MKILFACLIAPFVVVGYIVGLAVLIPYGMLRISLDSIGCVKIKMA